MYAIRSYYEVSKRMNGTVEHVRHELAGHGLVEAVDTGNTVTDGDNRTGFADFVITSYSIHYTKLYDWSRHEEFLPLFDELSLHAELGLTGQDLDRFEAVPPAFPQLLLSPRPLTLV